MNLGVKSLLSPTQAWFSPPPTPAKLEESSLHTASYLYPAPTELFTQL